MTSNADIENESFSKQSEIIDHYTIKLGKIDDTEGELRSIHHSESFEAGRS